MRIEDLKNHWALVTGASSGIGHEFAVQLAAAGVNLVLVARRAQRLQSLGSTLRDTHGVQVLVLAADLAKTGVAAQVRARLRSDGVTIRLLVNNAALGRWARFEASPGEFYEEMIRVNAVAMVSLCRELLPDLTRYPSSAIINVSSAAAYQPVPYMAVYAATKAFVHSFSQALHAEWRERGVLVQTLVPGHAETELEGAQAGARGSAMKGVSAVDEPVRAALTHLGTGVPVVVTARMTFWQRLFALLPSTFVLRQVSRMFRPSEG